LKDCYFFFAALTLAHLALAAARIRARPAAEMWRLGAMETTFWPRVRAQRALCAAAILARAAALFSAMSPDQKRLYVPLKDSAKLLCVTADGITIVPNGTNEDAFWIEHPNLRGRGARLRGGRP